MLKRCVCVKNRQLLSAFATMGLVLAGALVDAAPAEARSRHRHRAARHQTYTPPFAAFVVDANSGRTLYAHNENELRHPASVTKVMTLYLLFEQLEKGRLRLDSEIRISQHAASMAPSKLGLRPGSTIEVEDAIKAVVTKSANDIAAAIGEAIGGTEERFAGMMTAKAHALGMNRTHYENASGLPDPEQVTTARDLSILGRAIQERFPKYFPYFATHQFAFNGRVMRNHNHLLGRVEGVDGIKTGYTRASGFNLLTSAKLGNRRIVSVVLGGKSARVRDQIMANLVDKHLESASPTRIAAPIVDQSAGERIEVARNDAAERREVAIARVEPPKPVAAPISRAELPKTLAFAAPTAAAAALAPSNPLIAPVAAERPRPAVIASGTRAPEDKVGSIPERRQISLDGSTRPVTAAATATPTNTPGNLRWVAGPTGQPKPARPVIAVAAPAPSRADTTRVAKVEPANETRADPPRPAAARTGVMIQIGATEAVGKANELLARARSQNPALASATAFTEKVQKGSETLFRARFAGLSENQADAACKSLKRTGFGCFATKN